MKKINILVLIIVFVIVGFIGIHRAKITYYASRYNGRTTALGERYSDKKLTCATTDRQYLGKHIKFFNVDTSVILSCNDMMAPDSILRFDLTKRAFRILNANSLRRGTMQVEFSVID